MTLMRLRVVVAVVVVAALSACHGTVRDPAVPIAGSLHELTVKDIDGKELPLSTYKGKVLLVVNVASRCGYTGQYAGLEKLYQDYKAQGFELLGFPSNDFMGQEPGTEAEIKTFCTLKYNVTFPMFSKVKVKNSDAQAPLYRFLAQKSGPPRWNFHKYIVGKDGQVQAAFGSSTKPEDAKLHAAIEAALR